MTSLIFGTVSSQFLSGCLIWALLTKFQSIIEDKNNNVNFYVDYNENPQKLDTCLNAIIVYGVVKKFEVLFS